MTDDHLPKHGQRCGGHCGEVDTDHYFCWPPIPDAEDPYAELFTEVHNAIKGAA